MFENIFTTALTVAMGLMGLSVVVIVHEFGHFVAARLMGIEVLTFSIGWGKKLLSFKKGKTEFCISLLPLGGYCRLKGEHSLIQAWEKDLKEIPMEEGAMYSAAPWKRILVSLAGPVFNLFFAVLVSTTLFLVGYTTTYTEPQIYLVSDTLETEEEWAADVAGLQSGDTILEINGREMTSYSDIEEVIALSANKELLLTVQRDGRILELTATPRLNKDRGIGILGIYPYEIPIIEDVKAGSPAEAAGFLPGDRILAVNGEDIIIIYQFFFALDDNLVNQSITVTGADGTKRELTLKLLPEDSVGLEFRFKTRRTPRMGPFKAFAAGVEDTTQTFLTTLKSFRLLFSGISMKNAVSGPLRITYYTGKMASAVFQEDNGTGLVLFVQFLSLISIALCFMNLLPIPALDGGQILLFFIEILKKNPIRPKMIYRYQLIGTIMVFALILWALVNDIAFFATQ